jgi:origin recognition complex subunit 2
VVSENHEDEEADGDEIGSIPEPTPRKPPGRAPKQAAAKTADVQTSTPSAQRHKTVAETPVKLNGFDTPSRQNIADRSARRKSARALIDRVISDAVSDDDAEEEDIAREIYESSEDEEADQDEQRDEEEGQEPTTPSKAPGRKRKAATARKRSPTPPRDLPPHELYFYQNKPGLTKTSNNNLSMLDLLTHDEYFSVLRQLKDPHASSIDSLQALHAKSFPQWAFELSQGFSTCLYGYGSKRRLLQNFATYLTSKIPDRNHKIIIINGYVRTLTPRDILSSLSAALPSSSSSKLPIGGSNPTNTLQNLLSHFSSSSLTITLLINSVDSQPLRKTPIQALLSQLASYPQIRLACTADSPDFHLLWDAGLRAAFNFVFHDCTTFAAFGPAELEVVDDVHELLGRKARRVGGKEGVAFVLRSLPENARSLFRLLVGEVLAASMDSQGGGGPDGDADVDVASVEYRMVYNKAVEEFICSSEMAFRTLLKE